MPAGSCCTRRGRERATCARIDYIPWPCSYVPHPLLTRFNFRSCEIGIRSAHLLAVYQLIPHFPIKVGDHNYYRCTSFPNVSTCSVTLCIICSTLKSSVWSGAAHVKRSLCRCSMLLVRARGHPIDHCCLAMMFHTYANELVYSQTVIMLRVPWEDQSNHVWFYAWRPYLRTMVYQ